MEKLGVGGAGTETAGKWATAQEGDIGEEMDDNGIQDDERMEMSRGSFIQCKFLVN